jgi:hypothetical protein
MRVSIEIEIPGLEKVLKEARGDRSLTNIGASAKISHNHVRVIEGDFQPRPNPLVPLPTLLRVASAVGFDVMPEVIAAIEEAIAKEFQK